MSAYYNEIDKDAAAWLRELIKAGHLPDGEVDERSIEDVAPADLRQFRQCHFFAGIGGWPLALRLAGWPDDRPVWTGSCPCQPFSAAGKGAGFDDERHLWPAWQWLIQQSKPATIFGEQVASKAADPWLDLVFADLEGLDYACGALAFPAAGIGAPHIRDRTYWVADCNRGKLDGFAVVRRDECHGENAGWQEGISGAAACSEAVRLADAHGEGLRSRRKIQSVSEELHAEHGGAACGVRPGPVNGQWRDADWLLCRDGKWRAVEPGTFPLVDGLPRGMVPSGDIRVASAEARVMRLRGYGNAIVPAQAAAFVMAVAA